MPVRVSDFTSFGDIKVWISKLESVFLLFFGECKGVQLFRDLNSCNKNIKRVLPRVCGAASVQAVAVRALCECKLQLFLNEYSNYQYYNW